jgi:hypothetical protein
VQLLTDTNHLIDLQPCFYQVLNLTSSFNLTSIIIPSRFIEIIYPIFPDNPTSFKEEKRKIVVESTWHLSISKYLYLSSVMYGRMQVTN